MGQLLVFLIQEGRSYNLIQRSGSILPPSPFPPYVPSFLLIFLLFFLFWDHCSSDSTWCQRHTESNQHCLTCSVQNLTLRTGPSVLLTLQRKRPRWFAVLQCHFAFSMRKHLLAVTAVKGDLETGLKFNNSAFSDLHHLHLLPLPLLLAPRIDLYSHHGSLTQD